MREADPARNMYNPKWCKKRPALAGQLPHHWHDGDTLLADPGAKHGRLVVNCCYCGAERSRPVNLHTVPCGNFLSEEQKGRQYRANRERWYRAA